MLSDVAIRARVTGRVQGVAFRAWTQGEALALGLRGWVRNEADGSVSALIVGPEAEVAALAARLRVGPPAASVTGVETASADPAEARTDFEIAPTVR